MPSHMSSGKSRRMTTAQREESTDRQRAERKLRKEQRNKIGI
jgi:hypothetical protein